MTEGMVIDTSAIMAILMNETGHEFFHEWLMEEMPKNIAFGTYVELGIVTRSRSGQALYDDAMILCEKYKIVVSPTSVQQAHLAHEGFQRFGKGQHPAGLNYGDCFTYALARELRLPILAKGIEFTHTDCHVLGATPRTRR